MSNNNSIITQNRNNNGLGETLFWKVFSNIYLLKYIIKKIQTVEWVVYDEHRLIGKENRWRFKDIYSLDWMVEKKQYPLLRNKIENDDYIHFDIETVEYIFERLSKLTDRIKVLPKPSLKKVKPSVDIELEKEKKKQDDQQEVIQLTEIIKLLLDKKRYDFEVCDLTKAAVKYDCLDALKILISEPHSIVVYPSTFDLAIADSHPSMVEELLQIKESSIQCNLVTLENRYRALKTASQSEDHKDAMIEFILNNPQLYLVPPPKPKPVLEKKKKSTPTKSPKQIAPDLSKGGDDDDIYEDIEEEELEDISVEPTTTATTKVKELSESESEEEPPFDYYISFSDFNNLKSLENKNKLMELDIVSKENASIFIIDEELKKVSTFEEMLVLLKIYSKYCVANGYHDTIPKKVQKKIDKIISKYGHDKQLQTDKFKRFLIVHLKSTEMYNQYILESKLSIDQFQSDGYYSDDYSDSERKFLALFRYIGSNFFKSYYGETSFKSELIKCMEKVRKQKLVYYEQIFDLVNTEKSTFNITNKDILDWLVDCDLSLVNTWIGTILSVELSSVQLYSYVQDCPKLKTLSSGSVSYDNEIDIFSRSSGLQKCFYKAIQECNIEQLVAFQPFISRIELTSTELQLPTASEDVLKVIQHFNGCNYKGFTMNFFYSFLKQVVTKTTDISLVDQVEIDFSLVPFSSHLQRTWLISSILALDFKITLVYLKTFKHLLFSENQLDKFANTEKNLFDVHKSVFHHYDYDENELISTVQILMEKWNLRVIEPTTFMNDDLIEEDGSDELERESYQAIFDYYFQIIIQIKGITLDKVYLVHKLLVDNSFSIQHTMYHSFYYLQLRSARFTKYILCRPGLDVFFDCQQTDVVSAATVYTDPFDEDDDYAIDLNGFNLQKYLDINEFTFDYILGGSFDEYSNSRIYKHSLDEILRKLVMSLSINIATQRLITDDFFTETLNADLKYFLDIKRFDLFFYQLQYVQAKLDETTEPDHHYEIDGFPMQYQIHDSPATELLPTSTIFVDTDKPKKLPLPSEEWKEKLSIPCATYINTFKFSDEVIDLAAMVMDVESLQKFISFNFYTNQFHDTVFGRSLWWSRFENSKFLLDNYDISIFSLPLYPVSSHYNYQGEFKFIAENYPDKVKDPRLFRTRLNQFADRTFRMVFINLLIDYLSDTRNEQDYLDLLEVPTTRQATIDKIILVLSKKHYLSSIEHGEQEDEDENVNDEFTDFDRKTLVETIIKNQETQLLIKSSLDKFIEQNELKRIENHEKTLLEYVEQDDSTFNEAFIIGNIKMCNLVLKHFPSIFKITKKSVKKAISEDRIHIIKYFYNPDNCKNLINNFQTDHELFNYLKQKLLNHEDYKFDLNWL